MKVLTDDQLSEVSGGAGAVSVSFSGIRREDGKTPEVQEDPMEGGRCPRCASFLKRTGGGYSCPVCGSAYEPFQ